MDKSSTISTTLMKVLVKNKGFCACYLQVILITWDAGITWYVHATAKYSWFYFPGRVFVNSYHIKIETLCYVKKGVGVWREIHFWNENNWKYEFFGEFSSFHATHWTLAKTKCCCISINSVAIINVKIVKC